MESKLIIEVNDQISLDYGREKNKLCGIPFIRIHPLNLSIQYMPVNKIQFEYFMADEPDPELGESVYNEILKISPRVSPRRIPAEPDYKEIFITGLKNSEILKYISWLGEDYSIPSVPQWQQVLEFLNRPTNEELVQKIIEQPFIPQRSKLIIQKLDEVNRQKMGANRTMGDQLLLRYGIKEWLLDYDSPTKYSIIGGKNVAPKSPVRINNNNALTGRDEEIGFRLIKKIQD